MLCAIRGTLGNCWTHIPSIYGLVLRWCGDVDTTSCTSSGDPAENSQQCVTYILHGCHCRTAFSSLYRICDCCEKHTQNDVLRSGSDCLYHFSCMFLLLHCTSALMQDSASKLNTQNVVECVTHSVKPTGLFVILLACVIFFYYSVSLCGCNKQGLLSSFCI